MTDPSTRQPPEKICIHFDHNRWMTLRPCKVGVERKDVTYGPLGNMCIATMPCYGMCDDAKCAKKKLKETKPEKKPDPQLTLF